MWENLKKMFAVVLAIALLTETGLALPTGKGKRKVSSEPPKPVLVELSTIVQTDEEKPVPAKVTIEWSANGEEQARKKATDIEGECRFDGLVAGEYVVTVTAPGYRTATRKMRLQTGANNLLIALARLDMPGTVIPIERTPKISTNERESDKRSEKESRAQVAMVNMTDNRGESGAQAVPRGQSEKKEETDTLTVYDVRGQLVVGVMLEIKAENGQYFFVETNEKGVASLRGIPINKDSKLLVTPTSDSFDDQEIQVTLNQQGAGVIRLNPRFLPSRNVSGKIERERPGQFYRSIIGFEQSGASSTPSSTNFFVNLYGVRALESSHRFLLWGDLRLSGLPSQQRTGVVKEAVTTLSTSFLDSNISQFVNALSFSIGPQYRIPKPVRIGNVHMYTNFVAGFGATTPIDPPTTQVEAYSIDTPTTRARLADFLRQPNTNISVPSGTLVQEGGVTTIDARFKRVFFAQQERNRFLRQYYGGVRFETFYLQNKTLPSIVDVAFGQNEAVTGGRLRGGVMRFDGFFPLGINAKIGQINFDGALYVFGTALLRTTRKVEFRNSLILPRFDGTVGVGDADLLVLNAPPRDRDFFRVGIGVDLVQLFKNR